jgi:hypothetical protein
MDWDLEYNAIVNLKEKLDPGNICPKLERTSKAHLRNSTLRSPGDCLRKYGIRPVEIYDSITELISDSARSENVIFNPSVPSADSGMQVKPAALPRFAKVEGPGHFRVKVEVASRAEIICSVDEALEGFVHSAPGGSGILVMPGGGDEFLAKEILPIH